MKNLANTSVFRAAGELDRLLRLLHDRWFDVADVKFDRAAGTVTVPFLVASEPKPGAGMRDCWLRIRHVTHMELQESEGVGRYDLNDFWFESEAGRLQIRTGIPLRFELKVNALELEVLDSRED